MIPVDVSWEVGVASEYVVRGVSQSSGHPHLFGGVELERSGVYAGAWASTVDFSSQGDRETSFELDVYGGGRHVVLGTDLDVGAVYYLYGDETDETASEFEVYALASRSWGSSVVAASAYYAWDMTGEGEGVWYVEVNATHALTERASLTAALGRQLAPEGVGYDTWSVGAAYSFSPALQIDVRYSDTDRHIRGPAFQRHLVVELTARF